MALSLELSWFLLSLLSLVGSFSPSLEFSWFLLPLLEFSWFLLSLSLEFSWFLLPLLSSVADLFFKLNFRFSDINISNISFNLDINLKK